MLLELKGLHGRTIITAADPAVFDLHASTYGLAWRVAVIAEEAGLSVLAEISSAGGWNLSCYSIGGFERVWSMDWPPQALSDSARLRKVRSSPLVTVGVPLRIRLRSPKASVSRCCAW